MSKYLKELMTNELKSRLEGVSDALVVDVIGMEANANVELRRALREKNMHLMVVKNSLARRATDGTALAPAFEGASGTSAVVWGGEDVVSLAKEVVRLAKEAEYEPFAAKGGVMDGEKLSGDDVMAVSKWPSREEQLSLLMGQILGPGATLSAQLLGPGKQIASQVKQQGEEDEA
ncbi:MAG: 50S ribosomal protein L10 [Bythopirellula sp.]